MYYPTENCKFAAYILRFAHEWKSSGKWSSDVDLIHWNAELELIGGKVLGVLCNELGISAESVNLENFTL